MSQTTINHDQGLFVISCGSGYSCLGFDVCKKRSDALADELVQARFAGEKNTIQAYEHYKSLTTLAGQKNRATGWRSKSELTPELIGLEGSRVEVRHRWNDGVAVETVRFWVGVSTGFIPCHLFIARRNCHGGAAVCLGEIISVQVVKSGSRY